MPDSPVTFLEAEARLGGTFLHPGGRAATTQLLEFLTPQPGDRVLELGCGPGTTTALVAHTRGVSVVAIDHSQAMLNAAHKRVERAGLADRVRFIRSDLTEPLPLPDESCDAVYAESVIALLEAEPVLREAARVLRPGGRFALNERIWRPAVSQQQVDHVNALSLASFGIPAATATPLDREAWEGILKCVGFEIDTVMPVAELPTQFEQRSKFSDRLQRYQHYLKHPDLVWRQLQFKRAMFRHRKAFQYLESFLFLARKPSGNSK